MLAGILLARHVFPGGFVRVFGYFAVGFWICNQPLAPCSTASFSPAPLGSWLIGGIQFR